MTIAEYKALVDVNITNKTVNYSISPQNVGDMLKILADLVPVVSSTNVPVGTITMFAPANPATQFDASGLGITGSAVEGWAICNGNSGTYNTIAYTTPNLKGKFVVGWDPSDVDYDVIGETGGAKVVTLNATQIPAHVHPTTAIIATGGASDFGFEHVNTGTTGIRNTNENVGGGSAHENRPPYYTVLYIKKIA